MLLSSPIDKNTVGITKYTELKLVNGKRYFSHVDIEVSLTNYNGGEFTDKNLQAIALHEIGHALGITYHSDNLNDIMYKSTDSYKNTTISKRDLNTLKETYRN